MGEPRPRPTPHARQFRNRQRLTKEQSELLEIEFQRDPNWTTVKIKVISDRLQIGRTKVYKWGWDRKKKEFA